MPRLPPAGPCISMHQLPAGPSHYLRVGLDDEVRCYESAVVVPGVGAASLFHNAQLVLSAGLQTIV